MLDTNDMSLRRRSLPVHAASRREGYATKWSEAITKYLANLIFQYVDNIISIAINKQLKFKNKRYIIFNLRANLIIFLPIDSKSYILRWIELSALGEML